MSGPANDERDNLARLLAQYRGNLQHLLEKEAQYGLDAPLWVLNQLEAHRLKIAELEAQLQALDARAAATPSPAEAPTATATPDPPDENPFGDSGRIVQPERFFDREDLLRQIFEELEKGVNLSLVGEGQVGKSSLLSMICALGPQQLSLPQSACIYISMQWVENEDEFYEALCELLGVETSRGFKLTRALRGKRYVVCIDEIEKMTWDGFSARVRSQLRGLAGDPDAPLRLVIASRSPLARLFPDSPELDSPLAGICQQIDIGPFPEAAARAFLHQRLHGSSISFSDDHVAELLRATNGHPARLQRAAATLYRTLSATPAG